MTIKWKHCRYYGPCHSGTGGVVGVDMDRNVGVTVAKCTDQHLGRLRLQNAGHVLKRLHVRLGQPSIGAHLNSENVGARLDELVREVHVVLQVVLGPLRVRDVAGVGDSSLDNAASVADRLSYNFA